MNWTKDITGLLARSDAMAAALMAQHAMLRVTIARLALTFPQDGVWEDLRRSAEWDLASMPVAGVDDIKRAEAIRCAAVESLRASVRNLAMGFALAAERLEREADDALADVH